MLNLQPSLLYCIGLVLLYLLGAFIRGPKTIGITALILFNGAGLIDYFFNKNVIDIQHIMTEEAFNVIKITLSLIFSVHILHLIAEKRINSKSHIFSIYALSTLAILIASTEKFVTVLIAIEACLLIITALTRSNYLKRNFLGICITAACYCGILASYGSLEFAFATMLDDQLFTLSFLILISSLIFRVCQFVAICSDRPDHFLGVIYSAFLVSIFPILIISLNKFGVLIEIEKFRLAKLAIFVGMIGYYVVAIYSSIKENSFPKMANIVVYLSLITTYILVSSDSTAENIQQAILYASYVTGLATILIFINNNDEKPMYIKAFLYRSLPSSVLFIGGLALYTMLLLTEVRMDVNGVWMFGWALIMALFGLRLIHSFQELSTIEDGVGMIAFNWLKFGLKLSLILGFSIMVWGTGLMNQYVH
jgi:hypothetical protein